MAFAAVARRRSSISDDFQLFGLPPTLNDAATPENRLRRHEITLMLLAIVGASALTELREDSELRELHGADTFTIKGPGILARDEGFKLAAEGNYAGALPLLERAAASAPVRTAAERIARATTENTLGGALKNLGRFDEAAAVFERALAAFEGEAHDAARVEAAVVTNNLGAVRAELGRADEAEALYEAALRVFADPELPATGARRADALNNLADLRHSQGDLEEAERLYADALARREAALGAEHPETAASVNNLAVLLLELRRHGEALPLLRRAANIARATAGAAHPHYATALGNLASGLQLLGKAAEARTRFARALKINAAALGDDHPSTTGAREALEALGRS